MNIVKIFFLILFISLSVFSQNNSLSFIQTKADSSWEKNIIIFPDSIFLSNYNKSDSCKIINNSNQKVYLDSIYNKYFATYYCEIREGSIYSQLLIAPFYKNDSIHTLINPLDTITFIIVNVNPCPICKKQYNEYLSDTLVFIFSSDSNQITEKLLLLDSDISLGVKDKNTSINSFYLYQNFPNPFNPSTKIRFSIPHSSFVGLKVYDVLGREIAIIVNEEKAAGNYEINFNAHNLSSGVYFYRMQADSFTDTKRLILLR